LTTAHASDCGEENFAGMFRNGVTGGSEVDSEAWPEEVWLESPDLELRHEEGVALEDYAVHADDEGILIVYAKGDGEVTVRYEYYD
jgi:hypothetical protein